MPQNKNAHLRYRVLDRCLQDRNRKWSKNDLINAIDEALAEVNPDHDGISVRTLQEDLRHMQSIDGFDAPIAYKTLERKRYYYYEDPDFRIYRSPLNEQEKEALKEMLAIFDRFDGAPQFEWMQDTIGRIEESLKLNRRSNKQIIVFDDNLDYTGRQFIRPLAKLIEAERKVKIRYQPFVEKEIVIFFQPRLLREYNNRWFLMGWAEPLSDENKALPWNLALDRIQELTDAGKSNLKREFDWEEYFNDIVGVSRNDKPVEEIVLKVHPKLLPYLETKPLHQSQRPAQKQEDGYYTLRYYLIPNYELEYQLLAFGEDLSILKPENLRNKLKDRIFQMLELYS